MNRSLFLFFAISLTVVSCTTVDEKKLKRDQIVLDGDKVSERSWNQMTSPNQVSNPMGMPMSR